MMKKLMLLGAGAVGYVLGARAGRERYDQIAEQAQKLRTNPKVQEKVDEAKHMAKDAAGTAVDKAKEKAHSSDSSTNGTAPTPMTTPAPGTTAPQGFGRGDESV